MASVIVVDDEEVYRVLIRSVLGGAGHDVTCFGTADEALDHLSTAGADVFVTDVFMPGKEGLETIREIRRDHPGLPIVAVSGGGGGQLSDAESFLRAAQAFGARAVVTKPFRAQVLLDALAMALSAEPGVSASA